jgi:hypothetical protein
LNQERQVQEVDKVINVNYWPASYIGRDLAMVILKEAFKKTDHVAPINHLGLRPPKGKHKLLKNKKTKRSFSLVLLEHF